MTSTPNRLTTAAADSMMKGSRASIHTGLIRICMLVVFLIMAELVVQCMQYFSIPVENDYNQYFIQKLVNTLANQTSVYLSTVTHQHGA
jgi:cell shape-determining protein MreD